MIKTLEVNNNGRDFVIGDLHGQLHLLEEFLNGINFDPSVDRVLSVGDLVDRGRDSLGCLNLINKPWFHTVKGNHEQLMEDFLTGGPTGAWWLRNGGNWWSDLDQLDKDLVNDVLPVVQKLPWLITVPMQDGRKFHVLHAELPHLKNVVITDEILACEKDFASLALCTMGDGEAALWGRDLWGSLYGTHIDERMERKIRRSLELQPSYFNDKLSHIYSGHTTMKHPTTIQGQTNLDTGAFRSGNEQHKWAGLTATEPLTGKFWTTNNEGVREVQPIVI